MNRPFELGWIAIAICVLTAPALRAQNHDSAASEREPNPGIYIPPNEQHPAVALPIFGKSNHGAYVSVGTERSFIGAAVTRAQALVVIDYDPQAVRFAKINRALLAASNNRLDYVDLRLRASQDVWQQRARQLTGEDEDVLSNPDSWAFWEKNVRKNVWAWNNAFQHFNTQPHRPEDPFFACDYLFEDGLYNHLRHLAKHSLIATRLIDLRHEGEVRSLCTELRSVGFRLGIIDTSDVPNPSEAGTMAASHYVKVFSQCAEGSTVFLNTAPALGPGVNWSYFAFRNRTIRKHDEATIQRWYEFELDKIAKDHKLQALFDDPAAVRQ